MPTPSSYRRCILRAGCAALLALSLPPRAFGRAAPVLIGLDAEFSDRSSTADDGIRFGAQTAVDRDRGGQLT